MLSHYFFSSLKLTNFYQSPRALFQINYLLILVVVFSKVIILRPTFFVVNVGCERNCLLVKCVSDVENDFRWLTFGFMLQLNLTGQNEIRIFDRCPLTLNKNSFWNFDHLTADLLIEKQLVIAILGKMSEWKVI